MTNPPTVSTVSINALEGTSSIANSSGNLLFYTDGITVWNQLMQVMANGTGLMGNGSTSQVLIVKQPGNNPLYFIFTADAFGWANGLRYSVVDISLAAGMGSVTTKNSLLITPSSEKITAVKHCNGIDTWVVTHDYNSNNFRSYLISSSGINTVSVNSAVGAIHNFAVGCMKLSPNGKKIGVALYGFSSGQFEMFDFDNSTGLVSNPVNFGNTFAQSYGCEFSSDGTKFYGSSLNPGALYQWDLCAGTASAVIASQFTVAITPAFTGIGHLQLAPNGKIYAARINKRFIAAINNPNSSGIACNYVDSAQSIGSATCSIGLPGFVTSSFKPPLSFTQSLSCLTASFTPPAECAGSGYSFTAMFWNFGDPASGVANTSTLTNAVHVYTSPGTYTAQLVITNACSSDTIKQLVITSAPNLSISCIPSTSFICSGQTATLISSGANTYTWNTNANTSSIIVSPTITTSFTVSGSNPPSQCLSNKTLTLSVSDCVGIDEQFSVDNLVLVFPNPNSGSFKIRIDNEIKDAEFILINSIGQKVYNQKIIQGTNEIKTNGLPLGLYHYILLQDNQTVKNGKLTME